MVEKAKQILKDLEEGDEIVVKCDKPILLQTYLNTFKAQFSKNIKTKILDQYHIKVICISALGTLNSEVEVKFKYPRQDYALAKTVIKKLKHVNTYTKVFINDIDQFTYFINLLKDKKSFFTFTTGISYRSGEYKVKKVT